METLNKLNEQSSHLNSTPVARHLVHKRAISEVLLTSVVSVSDDQFIVSAQWPRMNWFYGNPAVALSPLLVIETIRQAWLHLSHSAYGAEVRTPLALHSIGAADLVPAIEPHPFPTDAILRVDASTRFKGDVLSHMDLRGEVYCGPQRVAEVFCDCTLLDQARYAELRGTRETAPTSVEPYRMRRLTREAHGTRFLELDVSHPVLFDHPSDHIPGMYFIAAASEAMAAVRPGKLTRDVRAEFYEYADVNRSPRLAIEHASDDTTQVRFLLEDKHVAMVEFHERTDGRS